MDLMALNTNNGSGPKEEGGESGESGIAGLGLELGLRPKVFLLSNRLSPVVDEHNTVGRSWPEHNTLDADTFHVICRYVHPSNCDQSTGSVPSKKCRARGGEYIQLLLSPSRLYSILLYFSSSYYDR